MCSDFSLNSNLQYNVGEKPTVILCTNSRHAGTPRKLNKNIVVVPSHHTAIRANSLEDNERGVGDLVVLVWWAL